MDARVRRGGRLGPRGFLFELTGGDVSLDLVNTVDGRPTDDVRELIPRAADLLSWGRQAGLLAPADADRLRLKAERDPDAAEHLRQRVVQLRECLFQLYASLADGRKTPPDVMAEWNRFLRESLSHYETARTGRGLAWTLRADGGDDGGFDRVLWPIVHSAMVLLTGPRAARIRRCASDTCDWLFLDTSKRGNRRWCDMTVCGNRAKARRFYERKRSATAR